MLQDPNFAAPRGDRRACPSRVRGSPGPERGTEALRDARQGPLAGPELGRHNDDILRGLFGFTPEQVAAAQATVSLPWCGDRGRYDHPVAVRCTISP